MDLKDIQVCAGVLPGGPLFVHVNDVLHQQVPLQSVNPVSVQDHLVSAGRAAETTSRRHRGAAPRRQVGIGRL